MIEWRVAGLGMIGFLALFQGGRILERSKRVLSCTRGQDAVRLIPL